MTDRNLKSFYRSLLRKALHVFLLLSLLTGQILPPTIAGAQTASILNLPTPGAMVGISPKYVPLIVKGIKVFPENPFRFEFILDTGHTQFNSQELNDESKLLIKYFLTALTIPDQDQWVNLSPFEKDRIVPNEFGVTEMGRDLLAQDYLLKQLTATLIYPENELGKQFWQTIYKKAYEKFGSTDIPVNTFNKVWIMPDHAKVYEYANTAVIKESRLKVLLEEDYVALVKSGETSSVKSETLHDSRMTSDDRDVNNLGSQIVREIVIPEIEREVNEGQNFAKLRQIYHSMIMAAWYKRKLKDSILGKLYVGANKVAGVDVTDKEIKQKIYEQYLEAYKKGVYNYIKEDVDQYTHEVIPRKYFSGGVQMAQAVDRTIERMPVNEAVQAQNLGETTGGQTTVVSLVNPIDGQGAIVAGAGASSTGQQAKATDGGALWDMGVRDSDQERPIAQATRNQWEEMSLAINEPVMMTSPGIFGDRAKVIVSEMPAGRNAFRFRNSKNELVIVLSPQLAQNMREEGIYHDVREDYWEFRLRNQWSVMNQGSQMSKDDETLIKWQAHVLASAEQSINYGYKRSKLTDYHQAQLNDKEKTVVDLQKMLDEDRSRQHELINIYLSLVQAEEYLAYEGMVREEIQKEITRRKDEQSDTERRNNINFAVSVFDGVDEAALRDFQSRTQVIESLRTSIVTKIKKAIESTGEAEGAFLSYEIGRLASAAVDSIIARLDRLKDSENRRKLIAEASITLRYEIADNKFSLSLSDNGEGMDYLLLQKLSGYESEMKFEFPVYWVVPVESVIDERTRENQREFIEDMLISRASKLGEMGDGASEYIKRRVNDIFKQLGTKPTRAEQEQLIEDAVIEIFGTRIPVFRFVDRTALYEQRIDSEKIKNNLTADLKESIKKRLERQGYWEGQFDDSVNRKVEEAVEVFINELIYFTKDVESQVKTLTRSKISFTRYFDAEKNADQLEPTEEFKKLHVSRLPGWRMYSILPSIVSDLRSQVVDRVILESRAFNAQKGGRSTLGLAIPQLIDVPDQKIGTQITFIGRSLKSAKSESPSESGSTLGAAGVDVTNSDQSMLTADNVAALFERAQPSKVDDPRWEKYVSLQSISAGTITTVMPLMLLNMNLKNQPLNLSKISEQLPRINAALEELKMLVGFLDRLLGKEEVSMIIQDMQANPLTVKLTSTIPDELNRLVKKNVESDFQELRANARDLLVAIRDHYQGIIKDVAVLQGQLEQVTGQSSDASNVGGIDLNANALNLQTEGSSLPLNLPVDLAEWQNIKFEGFTPVILEIKTTNIPLFLGAASESESPVLLSSV